MILHAHGFVRDGAVTSVQITSYEGNLSEVVNGVLNEIKRQGHDVSTTTTRTLGGWLVAVDATVGVGVTTMWHRFSEPSDPWPMHSPPTAEH